MKVRVIRPFRDILDLTITHKNGDTLDLDDKVRVENAVKLGYVEVIEDAKPEKKQRTKK